MFIIRKDDQPIRWPVNVPVPQQGGKVRKYKFTAHFQSYTTTQIADYAREGDEEFIKKVLVGWDSDLKDETETPVPFNEENLDYLIHVPYIKTAIIAAYYEMMNGIAAKNS